MDYLDIGHYNYYLPQDLIAQHPLEKRINSRLLVVNRKNNDFKEDIFYNIDKYLQAGDVLVINTSKVFPARLYGYLDNGYKIEVLLVSNSSEMQWTCMAKPGRKLKKAQRLYFSNCLRGMIHPADEEGLFHIEFSCDNDFWTEINIIGHVPLPPYIKREDDIKDRTDYQTVYAKTYGSIAAPTAGLHFDNDLIELLKNKGIKFAEVILHVGPGTFLPVKSDNIKEHKMHHEHCQIDAYNADIINKAKIDCGRVIAIGTTSARTLESLANHNEIQAGDMWTDLFIYPSYKFKIVDAILTNFHLPKSTLLMLVAAFSNIELIREAYDYAIQNKFRFFSYGDAMFIH